jgi:hypothetical protein
MIDFPSANHVSVAKQEYEDGYLEVSLRNNVIFGGLQEVQQGLSDMVSCIVLKDKKPLPGFSNG